MSGPVEQASRPIAGLDAAGSVAPPIDPPITRKTEPDGFDRGRARAEEKHQKLEDIYAALSSAGYNYDDFPAFLSWRAKESAVKGEGEKPDVRHGFKLLRADELEMRAPVYIIARIIETDCTGQTFGDIEAFKTFLVVGMGCSVATGTPFYGLPVRKGPVILIVGEGGGGIARRLKAWQIVNKVSLEGQPLYVSAQAAAMTEKRCIEQIIESVDEIVTQHGPPALIIIDTLSRNFGAGSENDPEDMGAYVAATNLLRERWRCTVLSVHHPGQAAKERSRGHYTFIGSLDFSFRCDKDESGTMRFECQKMKDAPHPPPMAFHFAEVALGLQDDQGREVTSGVLVQTAYKPPLKEGKAGHGKWQTVALEILRAETQRYRKNYEEADRDPDAARVSASDWREACARANVPRNRFYEAQKALLKLGFVKEEDGFVKALQP